MNAPGASPLLESLWRLRDLPAWLRPEPLLQAMRRRIPEFASGSLALREVRPKRVRMKPDCYGGTFKLTVEGPGATCRVVNLLGRLDRSHTTMLDGVRSAMPFGETGWQCALPELGLLLETPPQDSALPAQPMLTDAVRARTLLEAGIRAGSPSHADIRIARCTPTVARYNPGSRCTLVYRLEYDPETRGRDWPDVVVAKTHRGDKGRIAWESMRALWASGLRRSGTVAIAEPLAYLPELRVLIQAGVPGNSTLADLVERVLLPAADDPRSRADLHGLLAQTARGLVELHHCGVPGQAYGWAQEMDEVRERIGRLAEWIPGFEASLASTLARLEELAGVNAAQLAVPSHRSFRPAQVLLHEGHIAFIDFDGFCSAEPATDLALFRASMKQNVLRAAEREGRGELAPARTRELLSELDTLGDLFLDEYEALAPVSRERVALWETLYLLENLLNTWEKVRPDSLGSSMALFEQHLRTSRLPLL